MSVARACKQCQARIRELEADLAGAQQYRAGAIRQLETEMARAEKAEKALEIAEAQVYRWSAGQRDTEQRLADSEARIAELEKAVDIARTMLRDKGINLVGP